MCHQLPAEFKLVGTLKSTVLIILLVVIIFSVTYYCVLRSIAAINFSRGNLPRKFRTGIHKNCVVVIREIRNGRLADPSVKASFNVTNNREITNNLRLIFKLIALKMLRPSNFIGEFENHLSCGISKTINASRGSLFPMLPSVGIVDRSTIITNKDCEN